MTAPKRCPTCKSTDTILLLKHPIEEYLKYTCGTCARKSIPRGATVAMFDNRTDGSRWYIPINREEDIIEMERIGKWAQEQGRNKVSLYVYTNWRVQTGVGPVSFSFGHENSMEFLKDRNEWLMKELPVLAGKFTKVSPDVFQATLDF